MSTSGTRPNRSAFADPTVPEAPFTANAPRRDITGHDALTQAIAGEPLPPADFTAERESLLARGLWIGLVGTLLLLAALFAHGSVSAADARPAAATARHHDDGFFPASANLGDALARARSEGKRGIAVLYEMNGCSDCARLRATSFKDAGLRRDYQRDFVVASVMADEPTALRDFDGKPTTQAEFAHAQRVYALPTVVFYDLDGIPVARQVGNTLALADWLRLGRYVREAGYEEAPFSAWKPAARKGS